MKDQWVAGLLFLACALAAANVHAGTVNDVGQTTHKALAMQASGRQSVAVRPMLKDVAYRTYERYLESFTYAIPEQFERNDSFSSDSGS